MKIFLNSPKENWIVDRLTEEWYEYNPDISTTKIEQSDLVWIISPWTWKTLNKKKLKSKKVVCTIHHIDPGKFNLDDFKRLDNFVDFYHVISKKTIKELKKVNEKKIFYLPFWIDNKKWFEISNKEHLRKINSFDSSVYLVGSFQRDTEKGRKKLPKLEKGPDIFIDVIKQLSNKHKNLEVVLTGQRRDFIISELNKLKIKFHYLGMVDYKKLNQLYNCLDLYVVSSRIEGGPAAIMECAITKTPIVSTDVGIASEVLYTDSIYGQQEFLRAVPNVDYAFSNIQKFITPLGFDSFISLFEEIYENKH